MYYYLYKNKIYKFELELDNSNYLISDDESLQDSYYIHIDEIRALAISNNRVKVLESDKISLAKLYKLNELELYDSSNNINIFLINGLEAWFNKEHRLSLKEAINIYKSKGEFLYPLWVNSKRMLIKCDLLLNILNQVELYSIKCFNVTLEHRAAIEKLNNLLEIESYDFTINYPIHLIFNTNEEVH